MKNKIIMLLLFVINISVTLTVGAKDIEVVFIEVEIYSIPASKKLADLDSELKGATLEESRNLLVHVGNDATVETGSQSTDIEENDMFTIYFKLDQAGKYFDVDFQLHNKSNQISQSISRLEDNPLNSPLAISASINGITKLVKIKTKKFENKALGLAFSRAVSNVITKHELAKEVAHCYIAHKRSRTEFYKNGSAEIYKELIDSLAGKSNRNKIINAANIRQTGGGSMRYTSRSAWIEAKKYCIAIEEKLASLE